MKNINKKRAFTLVEMLISIALFMIFLTTLFGAYSSLIGSQKDSNAVRVMYSGARDLFAQLSEDVRLSTIDYFNLVADKHVLQLLSKDGLKQTVYRVVDKDGGKRMEKSVSFRTDLKCPFPPGIEIIENIASNKLEIADFNFLVTPVVDPYSHDSSENKEPQLQPMVTFLAEFKSAGKFSFPLQASVSSRVYTKVDERDRINLGGDQAVDSCGI